MLSRLVIETVAVVFVIESLAKVRSQKDKVVAAVTLHNTSLVGSGIVLCTVICNISAVRYFYMNFATWLL